MSDGVERGMSVRPQAESREEPRRVNEREAAGGVGTQESTVVSKLVPL